MTETIDVTTFEVRKDDWSSTRIVTEQLSTDLSDGEVILAVDRQALTANNISYAASGDVLGYWGFFPAEEGWGRIPAMGWAEVAFSAHPQINVGERVWGFFPFSTHLKIIANKVKEGSFTDSSPHRKEYAPVYASFDRASGLPIYDPQREDQDSLVRGLFMTSWLVEDFLEVNDAFGASTCLITSASSKTSIALAHCVKSRARLKSVGLTSAKNVEFCQSLGYYDEVLSYDDIGNLDAAEAVVTVDMAGSATVLTALHNHYGENMKYSCRVGGTHYEDMGPVDGLPGATPEFFFAPGHIQTRSKTLGAAELMMQLARGYVAFRAASDDWLVIERSSGTEAVKAVYLNVLNGSSRPESGQIFSMRA